MGGGPAEDAVEEVVEKYATGAGGGSRCLTWKAILPAPDSNAVAWARGFV